jgi:hypothetical protein
MTPVVPMAAKVAAYLAGCCKTLIARRLCCAKLLPLLSGS